MVQTEILEVVEVLEDSVELSLVDQVQQMLVQQVHILLVDYLLKLFNFFLEMMEPVEVLPLEVQVDLQL